MGPHALWPRRHGFCAILLNLFIELWTTGKEYDTRFGGRCYQNKRKNDKRGKFSTILLSQVRKEQKLLGMSFVHFSHFVKDLQNSRLHKKSSKYLVLGIG